MQTILIKVSDQKARSWQSVLRDKLKRDRGTEMPKSADLSEIVERVLYVAVAEELTLQAKEALAEVGIEQL